METTVRSDPYTGSSSQSSNPRTRFGVQFPALNFFQSPLSIILEYSGIIPPAQSQGETQTLIHRGNRSLVQNQLANCPAATSSSSSSSSGGGGGDGEVAIRIIGAAEGNVAGENVVCSGYDNLADIASVAEIEDPPTGSTSTSWQEGVRSEDGNSGNGNGTGRDSAYHRYELQQAGRWIEQILPFSLLLLVVFIRQHLQGFFVTIWIAAVMFKSNDILRKQTALKGERKNSVLVSISIIFLLYVVSVYWWYHNDDVLSPLVMLPPKATPPFWHAIFIILLNDIMVRQVTMALKCLLLLRYKNGRGHTFRRQGQMLTLVEYTLLLYRALLPTPVWYRFFLNKEYGSLFSSLTTGLYLTFKLTSVIEKVRSFFAAIRALSHKEVHYGAYATKEQVNDAGDLCAICQEKMQVPVLLQCKHIFCEECVSEWFERERTCPLCRALVKPADLQSFGDGSTSLFFQLF